MNSQNLNLLFREISTQLLNDGNLEAMDLKKLLYYSVNPYRKNIVTKDLINNNLFLYDYIFDYQKEKKNIINIHLAGGDIRKDNYLIENNYFIIDIYVHKDKEGIKINDFIGSRSVEIMNKIRKILDGKELKYNNKNTVLGLDCLNFVEYKCSKIQDVYFRTELVFLIKNAR